jgi:hypothetical protein
VEHAKDEDRIQPTSILKLDIHITRKNNYMPRKFNRSKAQQKNECACGLQKEIVVKANRK